MRSGGTLSLVALLGAWQQGLDERESEPMATPNPIHLPVSTRAEGGTWT